MKGKDEFSVDETESIRNLLHQIRKARRDQQKMLRETLRKKYRFYITDFDNSNSGFTANDFDELIRNGRIRIVGH